MLQGFGSHCREVRSTGFWEVRRSCTVHIVGDECVRITLNPCELDDGQRYSVPNMMVERCNIS